VRGALLVAEAAAGATQPALPMLGSANDCEDIKMFEKEAQNASASLEWSIYVPRQGQRAEQQSTTKICTMVCSIEMHSLALLINQSF
jgi:hypothetical protein